MKSQISNCLKKFALLGLLLTLPLHAQQPTQPAAPSPSTAAAAADDYQTQPKLPGDMKIIAQAASDFFAEKKYDQAAACYGRMLQKYPRLLYAWSNLAVVYYHQNKIDEAEQALRTAIKLSPKDVFSLNLLGMTLMQQEKYEEAVDHLRLAFQLSPQDTRIALRLATALSTLNRDDEMRAVLKQAQDNNPGDAKQRDATPR